MEELIGILIVVLILVLVLAVYVLYSYTVPLDVLDLPRYQYNGVTV